jgi:hypothetical protein
VLQNRNVEIQGDPETPVPILKGISDGLISRKGTEEGIKTRRKRGQVCSLLRFVMWRIYAANAHASESYEALLFAGRASVERW